MRARDIDDGVKVLINEKVSAVSFSVCQNGGTLLITVKHGTIVPDNIFCKLTSSPSFVSGNLSKFLLMQ